jgi:HEAT repeat protein
MARLTAFLIAAASAGALLAPSITAQQTPPPTLPMATMPVEEAAAIAQYWALLAEGRAKEAGPAIYQLLNRYPRNIAVLSLAIEVDIARGGAATALATYEGWLGSRTLEEPAVVRRVARALLYEWARQTSHTVARGEALDALAQDGDESARAVLLAIAQADTEAGLRMGVHLKDPKAIGRVAERLRTTRGSKMRDIELLARSDSPLAVPALVELLRDTEAEHRAAAADGLGRIGGSAAERALGPMINDPHGAVKTAASAALFKLGNFAGLNLLNELAASPNPAIRAGAAMLMASRPDETWKALVRGLLSDPDPTIRLDAATMLAPHEPTTARPVLDQLAYDSSLAIREETELVIATLPVSTLVDLRSIMRVGRPLARVRAAGRVLEMTR